MSRNEGRDVCAVADAARCKLVRPDLDASQSLDALLQDDGLLARLSCRVCRGSSAEAFLTLHPDGPSKKPWSWVVGDDGIRMLLGGQRHGSAGAFVLERLRSLGFNDFWVRKKLADGERFRLALFPRASAFAATWDGIMSLVREHYPQRLADKVTQHETSLRSERFEAIQAQAGFLRGASYFEINEAAAHGVSDDTRYIDTARLGSDDVEGTLGEVRGWLYFVLGCSDLFDGEGWTRDASGRRVVREYLMPNRFVDDFDAFEWVDLPLALDDLPGARVEP